MGHPDLTAARDRWPRFAGAAAKRGFAAVDALPMRLRGDVIGALDLFRTHAGELTGTASRTARALVDVATIGLLQERSIRHHEVPAGQLQAAPDSRVVIEQAKGVVAERLGVGVEAAFAALRGYARSHNLKLSDVASAVTTGRDVAHELFRGALRDRASSPPNG